MLLSEDTILENRYRIDGLLARGGMGAIYRAFDTNLNIPVAIKENFYQTPEHIAQFKQEALILARLRHPSLPRVIHHFSIIDPHTGDRRQYLVMDFIEGEDLWEMVQKRGGALTETEALKYIIQVCRAVTYLHQQKPPIIHRDIKPQNIKITPRGEAVLVDFGIAKQAASDSGRTHLGAQGVTPGYSSPEQYTRQGTTPASDIYSLGATLYAVLTGERPPDSMSLTLKRASLRPPHQLNPHLNPRVSEVILHAMQLEPADRPASVKIWQQDLEDVLAGEETTPAEDEDTLYVTPSPTAETGGATLLEEDAVYWLVDASGLGYPVGAKPLVIGRHSESDIVLKDLSVSRVHAHLRLEGGRCLVKDSGSANGTFINGQRLGTDWHPLNSGDTLTVGSVRLYLTATRPTRVAAAVDTGAGQSEFLPGTRPAPAPAMLPAPRGGFSLWGVLVVLGVLVVIVAAAGYFLLNRGIFSGGGASTALTEPSPTATLTGAGAASAAATTPTSSPSSTATSDSVEQAVVTPTATAAALEPTSTQPPTASPAPASTNTPSPSATVVPTRTPTAAPTATPTPRPVAVSGPTVMPVQTVETIAQIGSREVIDVDINPKNPREVYVLVKGDGFYRSVNGGDGPWGKLRLDASSVVALVIDPSNPARLYAPTWNAVLKSTDGGNTWKPMMNGLGANRTVDVVAIDPTDPNRLYGGIGETLVVSTDGGENWSSLDFGEGLGLFRFHHIVIDPFNPDIIFAGGEGAALYKSVDRGRTFQQIPYNVGKGTYGLAAHPKQPNVYLAGINRAEAGIIRTENGWDFVSVSNGLVYGGADSAYSAITFAPSNPNIVYAGSGYESDRDAKGVYKSTDGGITWTAINNGLKINNATGYPHYVKSIAVHPSNPNIVFAATGSGLYKTVDGGQNWELR